MIKKWKSEFVKFKFQSKWAKGHNTIRDLYHDIFNIYLLVKMLRVYCIDRPRVPVSNVLCIRHSLLSING